MSNTIVIKIALHGFNADNIEYIMNGPGWEGFTEREKIAGVLGLIDSTGPALVLAPAGTQDDFKSTAFDGTILDLRIENRPELDEEDDD
jgi:hypothetical protein